MLASLELAKTIQHFVSSFVCVLLILFGKVVEDFLLIFIYSWEELNAIFLRGKHVLVN